MSTSGEGEIVREAREVVREADERGITIRILGAAAFWIHCPKSLSLYKHFGRELSDIDVMGLQKQERQIYKLLEDFDYKLKVDTLLQTAFSGQRKYFKQSPPLILDIFLDKLEFCHTINLKERLGKDYPTISIADLLLEKMQIVQITKKDIIDSIVLLREHDVGPTDEETLNSEYIAQLTAADWGLYYTTTGNLRKLAEALKEYDVLTVQDRTETKAKIEKLLAAVERREKSLQWRLRARIGTRKKWFREPEDIRGV